MFVRPTLPELIRRIQADFVSRLGFTGGVLRRAVVTVLARVVAGAAHMMHGHLDFLGRQIFPDTSEEVYLLRQAALFGVSKNAATFTDLTVAGTGDGSTVPAGTLLVSTTGDEFETAADASGLTFTATITALTAGAQSRLVVDDALTFSAPIAGIDSSVIVTAVNVDGSDEESTEDLRTRFIARLADKPQGGTAADYVEWALEVAGVTRVWVAPRELGAGTVVVRFVRDNDPTIFPSVGEVATVQAYLDTLAPAHAAVTAFAPTALSVYVELQLAPNTVAVRAAVLAALQDLFLTVGAPGGTVLVSAIQTAIGTAAGVTDYNLLEPSANVVATTNQLPTLNPTLVVSSL